MKQKDYQKKMIGLISKVNKWRSKHTIQSIKHPQFHTANMINKVNANLAQIVTSPTDIKENLR